MGQLHPGPAHLIPALRDHGGQSPCRPAVKRYHGQMLAMCRFICVVSRCLHETSSPARKWRMGGCNKMASATFPPPHPLSPCRENATKIPVPDCLKRWMVLGPWHWFKVAPGRFESLVCKPGPGASPPPIPLIISDPIPGLPVRVAIVLMNGAFPRSPRCSPLPATLITD